MTVYIEFLSLRSFFADILSELINKRYYDDKTSIFYFIDANKLGVLVANLFSKFLGCKFNRLDFKHIDIKDEKGDLISLRIGRKDIHIIQDQIFNSDAYKVLLRKEWKDNRIIEYLQKGILDKNANQIYDKHSIGRALFLLQVVSWHMKKIGKSKGTLFLKNRGWMNIFSEYGLQLNINVIPTQSYNDKHLNKIVYKYPYLYNILKFIKTHSTLQRPSKSYDKMVPKLFLDSKKHYNFNNDGYKSDFSFCDQSDFPIENILVRSSLTYEKKLLSGKGFHIADGFKGIKISNKRSKVPLPVRTNTYIKESNELGAVINKYNFEKSRWASFFKSHNVKVFLSWYKFSNSHIAMADAIEEIGGISVIEQITFDGVPYFECKTYADVVFGYSIWCSGNEKKLGSKIPYYVVTGHPVNYSLPKLRMKAQVLRERLQSHGAKKIVAVFDENSIDDERWNSGHKFQIENYQYLLEEVLKTPWLGVIFKPKKPSTLRNRLKTIEPLLKDATATGRCHVFEDSSIHQSLVPAVLAALSSDICIHAHLFAGTAGIESALAGIPTLLIDREGLHKSKLYELEKGKVIFSSWPETIDALYEHFQFRNGVTDFGDWTKIINKLDPFRDGLSEYRKGGYLKCMMDGFKNGLKREEILTMAADTYVKKWGYDKIISV
jgi:hypothetical protein